MQNLNEEGDDEQELQNPSLSRENGRTIRDVQNKVLNIMHIECLCNVALYMVKQTFSGHFSLFSGGCMAKPMILTWSLRRRRMPPTLACPQCVLCAHHSRQCLLAARRINTWIVLTFRV